MATKGIDVSQWQGNINWSKVKSDGIEFAILPQIDKLPASVSSIDVLITY